MICLQFFQVCSHMVGILLHHITGLPNAKSGTTLGNYTLCHVTPAIPRSHSVNINTTLKLVGGVRFLCIVLATSANHTLVMGIRICCGVACTCSFGLATGVFGWCMLLVSVLSVTQMNASGMFRTCLACASCLVTIL